MPNISRYICIYIYTVYIYILYIYIYYTHIHFIFILMFMFIFMHIDTCEYMYAHAYLIPLIYVLDISRLCTYGSSGLLIHQNSLVRVGESQTQFKSWCGNIKRDFQPPKFTNETIIWQEWLTSERKRNQFRSGSAFLPPSKCPNTSTNCLSSISLLHWTGHKSQIQGSQSCSTRFRSNGFSCRSVTKASQFLGYSLSRGG